MANWPRFRPISLGIWAGLKGESWTLSFNPLRNMGVIKELGSLIALIGPPDCPLGQVSLGSLKAPGKLEMRAAYIA